MRCSACESENPAGKRFCGDCGAALENRCPQCGADNPASKKFCGDCGAPIAPPAAGGNRESTTQPGVTARSRAPSAETRKVISVIFADLMGSTALHERMDPESVNRVMDAYYRAVRGPVEAAGGVATAAFVGRDDELARIAAALLHRDRGAGLPDDDVQWRNACRGRWKPVVRVKRDHRLFGAAPATGGRT